MLPSKRGHRAGDSRGGGFGAGRTGRVGAQGSRQVAADVKITGTVRDTDGVPLIGATLIVEGTTLGTSTGVNGEYALNVPANGRIVCSYLGYDAVTEAVNAVRASTSGSGPRPTASRMWW